MKAIILSAGQGKRLLPLTAARPKCLLPFSGLTLLEWQVRSLVRGGVSDIVVVTGFGADAVEQAVDGIRQPGASIRTLFNPFYAVADNIGSCFVARGEMAGDFVLLNGDTLFEPAVLAKLLAEASAPITVTIDRKRDYDADDMKVCLAGTRLSAIGKTLAPETVGGESIGLLRFRGDGGERFAAALDATMRKPDGLKLWYLSVVDLLARDGTVGAVSIEGLEWAEIDYPVDVRRAEALVRRWTWPDAMGAVADAG